MEIDLSKVIGYSKNSLQSRALMKSIMLDLYPGKTREMNVLLDVYESGVPQKIKNEGAITTIQYEQYVQKIVDDYGLQQQYVEQGLDSWIDVCLKSGTARALHQTIAILNDTPSNMEYSDTFVHNEIPIYDADSIKGNLSDYQIKDVGNGKIEIEKFLGLEKKEIIIPTQIEGKRVIGIGVDAFKFCKELVKLIIPEGIEYISEGSFAGCDKLCEIKLPMSLKELGKKDNRPGIKRLINKQMGVFEGAAIKEIILPNNITVIESHSFRNCKNLKKICFPNKLKVIGSGAFSGCSGLEEVILPPKVEQLKMCAFSYCTNLDRMILNEGLTRIESGVFYSTPKLTYLVIPSSVTDFERPIWGLLSTDKEPNYLTLGCYSGTKAIQYARENNLKIVDASN